jgi:hypothetical protein
MRLFHERQTLVATQRVGDEVAEDEDQDRVCEYGHFVPLVGASSSFLTRIWCSGTVMKAMALSPKSENERLRGCVRELINN